LEATVQKHAGAKGWRLQQRDILEQKGWRLEYRHMLEQKVEGYSRDICWSKRLEATAEIYAVATGLKFEKKKSWTV
jgi:hypothetical protein